MNDTQTWLVGQKPVVVSHPHKVLWEADDITKEEMLRYYETVAPYMLPHLRDRPVTLRIFPEGIQGDSYYRRDAPEHSTEWLRTVDYIPETSPRTIQLPLVDDAAALLRLAEGGATEFHLWASRLPNLHEPDMAIFDLDPGDEANFDDVLQAALILREALDKMGITAYPKTSGGRGIHVYVPLAKGHTFAAVRSWVRGVAEQLAALHGTRIAVAHGATHRGKQITVDHAQNSVGRNTASVYTLRGQPGAPVSCPLRWSEVDRGQLRPLDLNLRTVPERLARLGDLFQAVLAGRQRLPH